MRCLSRWRARTWSAVGAVLAAAVGLLADADLAVAQQAQVLTNTNAVGGVFIDPAGMLMDAEAGSLKELGQAWAKYHRPIDEGLARKTGARRVSLRQIEAALAECRKSGKPLPEAVEFLGGLQAIEYVLVYPEQNDILLVGPGEGWKLNDRGAVVGATTGRPVLLLDDLRTALRAASAPTPSVMSCSIDPTPEGLQRVRAHVSGLRTIGQPTQTALGIEEQLGPQKITVGGVPDTSHFARVMVAADYRMKRISMGLEPSPVAGLESFVKMSAAGGRGMSNMLPRWWLAPDFAPPQRDADGLAWRLPKAGVKAMAESDFFDAAGVRQTTAAADPVSQRWAEQMTARYDDLALADPIFGQLRNCMDAAVVAVLVVRHDLPGKAGLSLPLLTGNDGPAALEFPAPKQVHSKAALAKKGRNWMIAAGGVQINPWAIVETSEVNDALAAARRDLPPPAEGAWWSN